VRRITRVVVIKRCGETPDSQAVKLHTARASRGGRGLTSRWRRGDGDGAGPHVGAVVLPTEPRGRQNQGVATLPLQTFLGRDVNVHSDHVS
jgi:hypothetical protein